MSPVPPRLSVIVPVYDVETYLPACLDSLAAQTLREIEVVVVDDGSPDGSALIAEEYARRDPRFRLVRQENQGLGAARNTGIDAAHPEAEFLAFVDSDDMVPADAYRLMLASLDASGSDFATGNVRHIDSRRVWQSPMHRFLGTGAEQRTHVTRKQKLLTDRIACNKVFRKEFWTRHGLRFPVGVLYDGHPRHSSPRTSSPRPSTSSPSPSTTGGCARARQAPRSPSAAPSPRRYGTGPPPSPR
ncbi:CDP-glycerol glycerophosphotransferase [Streptomyces sp. SolWspMP-sol7th]|nr:glycosyltransferase [Streptomyces sp. SolWspMP-sol7th]SCD48542.1 CDP-glycerol glycerophosphotransferase [Streptomyces sp. SolWspMP-sol7th]